MKSPGRIAQASNPSRHLLTFVLASGLLCFGFYPYSNPPLYVATPLTQPNEFTSGIEGPACDQAGHIYAVNFARQQTIGQVTPNGKGEVWLTLPGASTGNGIVFGNPTTMFVADYAEHQILKIDLQTKAISTFAADPAMNQPNDLAIAPNGSLYASDPNWDKSIGQVWHITPTGQPRIVFTATGTTNGIEVSPDGSTLYVNETSSRKVFAFPIEADGSLGTSTTLIQFPDEYMDGMRCDIAGNIYVTRYGTGQVVKLSLTGEILKRIDVLGKNPSNICFGGPDGCTAYVTEVEQTRLVQFRVETPGASWSRWQKLNQ
jgi:gluconolactonase